MKKPLLLNFLSNSNFELIEEEIELTEQLKNMEKITNTTKINPLENDTFHAPEGMKWDLYGNPEFIED